MLWQTLTCPPPRLEGTHIMMGKFTQRPAVELVYSAKKSLGEAHQSPLPHDRYAAAHLAALRAAAAVLADRAQVDTGPRRHRIRSVWEVLPRIAPEFSEWADFFAAGARKRASAEAGIPCVTAREADDLLRDSERFLLRVAETLNLLEQSSIPLVNARMQRVS
jgi:SAV_6107-like HEPN